MFTSVCSVSVYNVAYCRRVRNLFIIITGDLISERLENYIGLLSLLYANRRLNSLTLSFENAFTFNFVI